MKRCVHHLPAAEFLFCYTFLYVSISTNFIPIRKTKYFRAFHMLIAPEGEKDFTQIKLIFFFFGRIQLHVP